MTDGRSRVGGSCLWACQWSLRVSLRLFPVCVCGAAGQGGPAVGDAPDGVVGEGLAH